MGEIIGPHNVVLPPKSQVLAADMVVKETGEDLVFDIAARVARKGRRILFLEAIVIVVPLLEDPRHPTGFVFHRDDLELGISFEPLFG